MSYIESWVSQLVVLVLFAVILELLLPSGGFQKYVKLVIGLVLIVALLGPVIKLFHMDPRAIINGVPFNKGGIALQNQTNQEKIEIEKQQHAYIQEQVAVQMKNKVKEALAKRYGLQIEQMNLTAKQDNSQDVKLQKVMLILSETDNSSDRTVTKIQPIQPVSISVGTHNDSDTKKDDQSGQTEQIRSFLAGQWQVNKQIIAIQIEGGG
ncbi:stage III sporulation protein AF [Sporolactobacillus spathodeae]|uniref:Stage III sporulation protein AF n=1 Tax=Sporolactobacillus spathodeae TaxID=1465502 RepID=A0ABS2QA73_9BACL|nr:stage III sporulation protein AF [Sporolactobacillus spathodeae]MBM7658688.1 stage III sporulation protein AF [Sporolactobacillus spathodeae]